MRHSSGVHLVVPPGGSFRETRTFELGPRVLTIGHKPTCDIHIDVPGVDDEHAKISEVALIAVGTDCAIGDVPLDAGQRRLVTTGDEIQIGSVVLVVDGVDASLFDEPRRIAPRIRVVEGANFGSELVLAAENKEYVIGRSPKADLVLEDREVSREHVKLVRRGNSIFLFDAASTRGSWLGRTSVYQATRVEWQRPRMLKVGATVLSLDLPDDGRKIPAAVPSAPMTAPVRPKEKPIVTPAVPVDAGPPPENIVAYHYQAKSAVAGPPGLLPASGDPLSGVPSSRTPAPPAITPSVPPPSMSQGGGRGAWKKEGTKIGRASGLLLLALGGLALLAVLFVVFSLME